MGIKNLNWNEVDQQVQTIAARRGSHTAGDLLSTLTTLANRLYVSDHAAHRQRLDEICRFLRAHYGGRQAIDSRLIDAMKEAFVAGIYAASECEYQPASEEIARLLSEARATLRTATPEDASLQAPAGQGIGENGTGAV